MTGVKVKTIHKLLTIADDLDAMERQGKEEDVPEGSRTVTASDTLITRIADEIRRAVIDEATVFGLEKYMEGVKK